MCWRSSSRTLPYYHCVSECVHAHTHGAQTFRGQIPRASSPTLWVLEMVLVTLLCNKHLYPLNRLFSFLFPFFLLFYFLRQSPTDLRVYQYIQLAGQSQDPPVSAPQLYYRCVTTPRDQTLVFGLVLQVPFSPAHVCGSSADNLTAMRR